MVNTFADLKVEKLSTTEMFKTLVSGDTIKVRKNMDSHLVLGFTQNSFLVLTRFPIQMIKVMHTTRDG